MSRRTTCAACQIGDHKRHRRVVQAVPEGMFGGSVCTCEGECAEDRDKTIREFLQRVGMPVPDERPEGSDK